MPASLKHLLDKKLNLTSLLARWNDGLYYTAAIVKCDKLNKKCLVCFEDGSEVWINNRDVHIQLTIDQFNEDEDIVCCICDDGSSEPPNEIILCDVCQQGYHQKCHSPPVDSSKLDESEDNSDHKDWFCATCSYILNQSSDNPKPATSAQQQSPSEQRNQQRRQPNQQSPSQPKPKATNQKQQTAAAAVLEPPKLLPTPSAQSKQAPAKTKPAPADDLIVQQPALHKQAVRKSAAVGPVKSTGHHQSAHKSTGAPYPSQPRVSAAASSSTAALASLTASSALVVGSSAGRTKQDLVNQGNRQMKTLPVVSSSGGGSGGSGGNNLEVITPPPVKHAVRKSSVNFVITPIKQSALPTATRSVLPSVATTGNIGSSVVVSSSTQQQKQPPPPLSQEHSMVQPSPAKIPHLIATTAKSIQSTPSLSQLQPKPTQILTQLTTPSTTLPPQISIIATTASSSSTSSSSDSNSNLIKLIPGVISSNSSTPTTTNNKQQATATNIKHLKGCSSSNNSATTNIQSKLMTAIGTSVSTTSTGTTTQPTSTGSSAKASINVVSSTTATTTLKAANNLTKVGPTAIGKPVIVAPTTTTPATTTTIVSTNNNSNLTPTTTNAPVSSRKDVVVVVSNNTVGDSSVKPTVIVSANTNQVGKNNNNLA